MKRLFEIGILGKRQLAKNCAAFILYICGMLIFSANLCNYILASFTKLSLYVYGWKLISLKELILLTAL